MALQPCRAGVARSRLAARTFVPCVLRSYSSAPDATSNTTTTTAKTTAAAEPTTNSTTTTTTRAAPSDEGRTAPVPRWSRTPPQMKADFQLDFAKSPANKVWVVNNDPRKLDRMYDRLLGPNGSRLLPEELKWLAVTHKSFDQGRRGFNDRLALLGRMALVMEATKHIVAKDPLPGARAAAAADDGFDRVPFEHAQLASTDNLNVQNPRDVVGKEKLYDLAVDVGLIDVVRWKPRLVHKLQASGVEVVLNSALMAIIGAVTLQHGSSVASQVIKERILAKVPA